MTDLAQAEVLAALRDGGPFTYRDEADLHLAICEALNARDVLHRHEVTIGLGDRIDLLTWAGVGVEVKVAGGLLDVVRQMTRYAHSPMVSALVLVTTQASHDALPAELAGVPAAVFSLTGQGL